MPNAWGQGKLYMLRPDVKPAGAGIDDPRYQVWNDLPRKRRGVRAVQIGLMAAPSGQAVVVHVPHVALEHQDLRNQRVADHQVRRQAGQDPFAREDIADDVPGVGALGRGHFRVQAAITANTRASPVGTVPSLQCQPVAQKNRSCVWRLTHDRRKEEDCDSPSPSPVGTIPLYGYFST